MHSENDIPNVSKLREDINSSTMLSICVTMYNEPFSQLLESVAGIYRAYYELVKIWEEFRNRVNIVIVWDGIVHLGISKLNHT